MQPRAKVTYKTSLNIDIGYCSSKPKALNIIQSYEEDHNNNSLKASITFGNEIFNKYETKQYAIESDCSLEDLYEIGQRMTKHHAEKLKKYQTDLDSIKRDPSGYINCYFDSIENKLKIFIDKATHHFDSIQSEVQRSKQECIASIRKCLDDFENVNVDKCDYTQRIISTLQYQLDSLKQNLFLNKDYKLFLSDKFDDICSFDISPTEAIINKVNEFSSDDDTSDSDEEPFSFPFVGSTAKPRKKEDLHASLIIEDETIIGVFAEAPSVTETRGEKCHQFPALFQQKHKSLNPIDEPIPISSKVYSMIQLFYFIKPVRLNVILIPTDGDYKSELVAIQRILYATHYLIDSTLESLKHSSGWKALQSFQTLNMVDLFTLLIDSLNKLVPISDLFSGQIDKMIKNVTTGKVNTEVKDSFYSLDVKVEKYANLDEYLDELLKDKALKEGDQNKETKNFLLPQVFTFTLQRDKLCKHQFSFPVDIDLSKYSIDKKMTQYKLLSFITDEHKCEKNCQHKEHNDYVLYADDRLDDVWFKCTEGFVTTCVRDFIIENSPTDACLLVYVNVQNKSFYDRKLVDIPKQVAEMLSKDIIV